MDELKVNPELCVDCGLCERNCPNNAIRVHDGVPLFCMHCSPEKAPCLAVCPKGAIVALGGAITIKQDKCIGCGLCHSVCPIGAITINEIGQATKCDLCEGYDTQQCVEACPTHALTNDTEKIIHDKQDACLSLNWKETIEVGHDWSNLAHMWSEGKSKVYIDLLPSSYPGCLKEWQFQ